MSEHNYVGLTPDQFKIINAVNTAPKALLHLSVETPDWVAPNELDAMFMDLQGSEPTWKISRGYCRAILDGAPRSAGTFDVSEKPFEAKLSDTGRFVGAPTAAHLLTIADLLGVRQTTLTGESTSPKSSNNTIELRYRAAQHIVACGIGSAFTSGSLAEELNCSLSAASGLVSELTGSQLLGNDADNPPSRNGYARYEVKEHDTDDSDDKDPLHTMIKEELQRVVGQTICAKTMANILGYNIKYAGKEIADYLEVVQESGALDIVIDAHERSRTVQITSRGFNAFRAILNVYDEIENPSAGFQRRGRSLAQNIRKDPVMVNRVLNKTPTKRGQRKSPIGQLRKDTPAVLALAERMPADRSLQTSRIQLELTGTSRTATNRLLKKGEDMGLFTRVKIGREYIWQKV